MFPSSVWVMKNQRNEFLFEHLLKITKSMSEKIDASMHSIFAHLQTHGAWAQLAAIENQSAIERQDDERVGLLSESVTQNLPVHSTISSF